MRTVHANLTTLHRELGHLCGVITSPAEPSVQFCARRSPEGMWSVQFGAERETSEGMLPSYEALVLKLCEMQDQRRAAVG
jgi:hypothetical protein